MMNSFSFNQTWGVTPWWSMGIGSLGIVLVLVFVAVVIALKGYSLWYAAKRNEIWWFIPLLVINTAGILELIYLIFIVKKWHKKGTILSSTETTGTTPITSTN
ncbi:MAG: DUF5652 family protein [Patescibacteria group bacterium]